MRIQNYMCVLIISLLELSNAESRKKNRTSALSKPIDLNPWSKFQPSLFTTRKKPIKTDLNFMAEDESDEESKDKGDESDKKGDETTKQSEAKPSKKAKGALPPKEHRTSALSKPIDLNPWSKFQPSLFPTSKKPVKTDLNFMAEDESDEESKGEGDESDKKGDETTKHSEAKPVKKAKGAIPPKEHRTSALSKPIDLNPWSKFQPSLFTTRKKPIKTDLNFMAEGESGKSDEESKGKGDESDKKGDETTKQSEAKAVKKAKGALPPKELTLSLPRFRKNEKGDWVLAYWGATMGNVWQDTRYNMGKLTVIPLRVDSSAPTDYYIQKSATSDVCYGRSTPYNVPRVMSWLPMGVALNQRNYRPVWTELRNQIYVQGRAEECHSPKQLVWREYMECAIRRNQRLEYLVPKYPLHQVGYRSNFYAFGR